MGASLALASLFFKAWRIHYVFANSKMQKRVTHYRPLKSYLIFQISTIIERKSFLFFLTWPITSILPANIEICIVFSVL